MSIGTRKAAPIEVAATSEPCERQQLQLRASQLERLLARLHERIRASDAERTERRAIHRAATEFSHELDQIRQRLEQPST